MAKFYSSDKMKLQLGMDYWYKVSDYQASPFPYKTQHKQVRIENSFDNYNYEIILNVWIEKK